MVDDENKFKAALRAQKQQIGLWLAMVFAYSAELCGHCPFDWCVIDAEHATNNIHSIVQQLQALSTVQGEAVVRIPTDDFNLLKQATDARARTIIAPKWKIYTDSLLNLFCQTELIPASLAFDTLHLAVRWYNSLILCIATPPTPCAYRSA